MNNPTLLSLFSAVFIFLGAFNLFTGLKRLRAARASGAPLKWHKQTNFLTGIEFILLALVFLLSTASRNGTLPAGLNSVIIPLYLVLLLAAAVLAGLVIRQSILNTRMLRAQSRSSIPTAKSNGTSAVTVQSADTGDPQQRTANLDRMRERRRNAAAARRRRAGKA